MNDQGSHEDAAPSSAAARQLSSRGRAPNRRVSRWHAAAVAWVGVAGLLACMTLALSTRGGVAGAVTSDSIPTPNAAETASVVDAAATAYSNNVAAAGIDVSSPLYKDGNGNPVYAVQANTQVTVTAHGFTSDSALPAPTSLGWYIVPVSEKTSKQPCEVASNQTNIKQLPAQALQAPDKQGNFSFSFQWPAYGSTPQAYYVCLSSLPGFTPSVVSPSNSSLPQLVWQANGPVKVYAPAVTQVSIVSAPNTSQAQGTPIPVLTLKSSNTTVNLPSAFHVIVSPAGFVPGQSVVVSVSIGDRQVGSQSETFPKATNDSTDPFTIDVPCKNTYGTALAGQLHITVISPFADNAKTGLSAPEPSIGALVSVAQAPNLPTASPPPVPSSILAVALDLLALALAGGGVFALWLGFAGSGSGGSGGNGGGTSGGYRQPVASAGRPGYGPPQSSAYGPPQPSGYGQQMVMPAPMPSGPLRMPPGQMPPSQMPGRPSPPPSSLPPDSPLYGHGPPADQQHPGAPGNGSSGP